MTTTLDLTWHRQDGTYYAEPEGSVLNFRATIEPVEAPGWLLTTYTDGRVLTEPALVRTLAAARAEASLTYRTVETGARA